MHLFNLRNFWIGGDFVKGWIWFLVLILVVLGLVMYGKKAGNLFERQPSEVQSSMTTNYQGDTVPSDNINIKATPYTITLSAVDADVTDQYGNAVFTQQEGDVIVTLNLMGENGETQPVHIHKGACPGVGAVVYPLQSVVDGKSITVFENAASTGFECT